MDASQRTKPAETFQELVLRLMTFWAEQGCLLMQPFDAEKGAGTYNPNTFLRAIGPEPWKAAYVEPSRRPTDGRYGENPNRLYRHHQFQVILKPSPPNLQELYLDSLRTIGVHPEEHDIRFVEDNWESPTLGAWGLGWEVWVDGMEATQFTYFQQCGGLECRPVAGELTYGLERLAMYLQNIDDVYELAYAPNIKYGEVYKQDEIEYSKLSFDSLDVSLYGDLYDRMERETERLVGEGLVVPAYDHLLHAAHAFNALDAKGAISVTERQGYILRIRDLAKLTAEAYLASREALGFPLGRADDVPETPVISREQRGAESDGPLFVELGTEELPAAEVESAARALRDGLVQRLEELRLSHGEPKVFCTPRRLAVHIPDVSAQQEDRVLEVAGPPVKAAFRDGKPTKAASGFAKGHGLKVEELEQRETPKGIYLYAVIHEKGKNAIELLPVAVEEALTAIPFKRSMRWGQGQTAFSRPVVWLVASHAGQVLPCQFGGVVAGAESRGHRFLAPEAIVVADAPEAYELRLETHSVMVDSAKRMARILEEGRKLAAEVGGTLVEDSTLLNELSQLVEWPVLMRGQFAEDFLKVPKEVLMSEMMEHQRYLPIVTEDGKLLPYFVVVANTYVEDVRLSLNGYRRVLTARFSDGAFFFEEDQKQPLFDRVKALSSVRFHRALGTVRDKVNRFARLSFELGNLLTTHPEFKGYESAEKVLADDNDLFALASSSSSDSSSTYKLARAAYLAKADLTTLMVFEFPELQGVMGAEYARRAGEPEEVAEAIAEHYLPRGADDTVPRGTLGALIGIADRFDTLVGIFATGKGPSGAADPFGLRRATLAITRILRDREWHLSLRQSVQLAFGGLRDRSKKSEAEVVTEVSSFFRARLKAALVQEGIPTDVAEATLSAGDDDVVDVAQRATALGHLRKSPEFGAVAETLKRVTNILKGLYPPEPRREVLSDEVEVALFDALVLAREKMSVATQARSYDAAFAALAELQPVVDRFFSGVMVMAEDEKTRTIRLGLLASIYRSFAPLADFTKLS